MVAVSVRGRAAEAKKYGGSTRSAGEEPVSVSVQLVCVAGAGVDAGEFV